MSDNDHIPQFQIYSTTPPIPKGTKPLEHQVAGHIFGRQNGHKKNLIGFLQTDDGYILKPVQGPNKGKREVDFYQLVFLETKNPELIELRKFLPTFIDIWKAEEHKDLIYLKIEDVTRGFKTPSIMDIKIGPVTYDCEADEIKILREKAKFPYLDLLGFQLVGIKVFSPVTKSYTFLDRYFLRALNESTIVTEGIHKYFNIPDGFDPQLVKAFLHKLMNIKEWFERQRSMAFIASSLLFIYDSEILMRTFNYTHNKSEFLKKSVKENFNSKSLEDKILNIEQSSEFINHKDVSNDCNITGIEIDNNVSGNKIIYKCYANFNSENINENYFLNHVNVKMIDFTHTFLTDEKDENYLRGLNGVIAHLQALI